jgi:tetratricopeptide (TPR) repeat protein
LKSLAWVALSLAAILAAYAAFLKRPRRRKQRWGWFVGVSALVLFSVGTILNPFTRTDDGSTAALQPSIDSLRSDLSETRCAIDSLKNSIDVQVSQRRGPSESLKEQAECIQATQVLRTALDSGLVAIGLGKYEEAILHLNYGLISATDDSSRAESFYYRGMAYALWAESLYVMEDTTNARTRYQLALAGLDSALTYNRKYPKAWYNRGLVLFQLGNYEGAIQSCDSAIAYKYNRPDVWTNRGAARFELGDKKGAMKDFDSALACKRDHPRTWYNRGLAQLALGDYEGAIQSCDSAIAYKYYRPDVWVNRGAARLALGDKRGAIKDFDSALACEPDNPVAWYNRGFVLQSVGDLDSAIRCYDSALTYQHDYRKALYNRAVAQTALGLQEEALRSCDSALHYNANDAEAAKLRAQILGKVRK